MKTTIRILDSNLNLLGEIDNYESLIFIRRFFKVGEFELRINIDKTNVDKLLEDNLIMLGSNGKKVGVIKHTEINLNENGQEELLIKGYTLKGIIRRRIIIPPIDQAYDNVTGAAENIMKHFVNNNFVNPIDTDRKITQLSIATDKNRGRQDKWRGAYENVSDKLEEIGEYSGIGWDVFLDIVNKKLVFDVAVGSDLTVNQSILPPVIFSVDFDNIKGQSYINSALNYSNVGYAGGNGDGTNRLIQQIGTATGFERIETFIDCSNAETVDELLQEGDKKLDEFKKIQTFESQVLDFGSFIYGEDWDLGDIVTVQSRKWNVTMDSRIIEVKEVYETNGIQVEPTFGDSVPTIIDKIKKIETKQSLRR